uniref:Uncharacterized protein n=1 Tax=Romanomermis culicivorax TaxID=13658 RepID=A0A915HXE9_ROMCU
FVQSTKILPTRQQPFLCGTNIFADDLFKITRQKRIVDGWTPEPYQAPWVGLLLKKGRVRCTAFLVSKKATDRSSIWALSAKHCFLDATLDDDDSHEK